MANPSFNSPINISIPAVITGVPDDLQPVFQGLANAIRTLQQAIGDFTGASSDAITYTLSLDLKSSQSLQLQKMQYLVLPASVALAAGDFINLFDAGGGVLKARKANASAIGTRAHGWVTAVVTLGAKCIVFLQSGYKGNYGGLTVGATYYLSSSTPGGISSATPVGSGKIVQEVGIALSSTELSVFLSTPIVNP